MRAARLILGQGTGVDLTPVPAIAERLEAPGTVFARVFTDREWAYCLGLDAEPLGGASGALGRRGEFLRRGAGCLAPHGRHLGPREWCSQY